MCRVVQRLEAATSAARRAQLWQEATLAPGLGMADLGECDGRAAPRRREGMARSLGREACELAELQPCMVAMHWCQSSLPVSRRPVRRALPPCARPPPPPNSSPTAFASSSVPMPISASASSHFGFIYTQMPFSSTAPRHLFLPRLAPTAGSVVPPDSHTGDRWALNGGCEGSARRERDIVSEDE
jgi:hypothetical protein